MCGMTTPLRATPLVADGEMPFTPVREIDLGSTLVNVYRVWVTPQDAKYLLSYNTDNRPVKQANKAGIKRAIDRDAFFLGPDCVAFRPGEKGPVLITGAHRLLACTEAKKPIEVLLAVGMGQGVKRVVDIGAPRTTRDNLGRIGPLATAVWRVDELGDYLRSNQYVRVQAPELEELLKRYPEVERCDELARQVYPMIARKETPRILGVAAWLMMRHNPHPAAVSEFMLRLGTVDYMSSDEPAALLRRKLLSPAYDKRAATDFSRLGMFIGAWNAFVSGDETYHPELLRKNAAEFPEVLKPGNEYPALLMVREPDAAEWELAGAA